VSARGRSYRLAREESAADGVRHVAADCAAKAVERLREAGEEPGAAIHGARKDLKKIRAVLRLVREGLGGKAYRAEDRRFRDAGRLLSERRDASVKLETLAGLREHFGSAFPASLTGAWTAALEADRDRLESDAGAIGGRVEEARAAIEAAAMRIPGWDLGGGSWELVEPGLTRSYRRGRAALRQTRAERSAADAHELRKRVKDLWYQLRLLEDAWPAQLRASAAEAHRLAELLGDHHDLAVLVDDLRERDGLEANRERAQALIAERQAEFLGAALDLGGRIYAEKPKCFRRRLRAYWRGWKAEDEETR
jgi:CHAD domain-containing protein